MLATRSGYRAGERAGLLFGLVALTLTFSACLKWEPVDTGGVRILNDTDETVTVVVLYPSPAEHRNLVTYRPGESSTENAMIGADGCTTVDIVALTEDGREIDRQPAPICRDEQWRIVEDE